MADAAWNGADRRRGAYDQRVWRDERRAPLSRAEGRDVDAPEGARPPGWGTVLKRVKARVKDDNLSIIAAGVAFYALLAIFPAMAALVAIYGLLADPATVERQVAALSAMLPEQAAQILTGQLQDLVSTSQRTLGLGAAFGILLALWSASKGIRTLMTALNVAYDEEESRGALALYGTSILLTFGAILGFIVMIAIIVALPVVARFLGVDDVLRAVIDFARWPVVAATMLLGLAILYRFGPDHQGPRWKWVSSGAVAAIGLWMVGSLGFSLYVTRFGNYNETYGSMGAVVILLLWFLLSAWAILIGAEINAERERQAGEGPTSG